MAQDFTTTALLASLKRRGMLPSTAETLGTSDFLAIATEELQSYMMSLLDRAREEFAIDLLDVPIVAGVAAYPIPTRAAGDKLRQVQIQYVGSIVQWVPLTRFEPERVHHYAVTGSVRGYALQGDSIILVPTPTTASTLRLKYLRRPGALVQTSAVAVIDSIDLARTTITTVAAVPSTFTSAALDVVDNNPAFSTLAMDLPATASGTSISLSTPLTSTVNPGDYFCLAGESPVAQIAVELHPLLIQRTKAAVLEALGDPKADSAIAKADKMEKEIWPFLQNRSEGNFRVIVNYNAPGFRRGYTYRR